MTTATLSPIEDGLADAEVREIVRCPSCRSRLAFAGSAGTGAAVTCTGDTCSYRRLGFPVVGHVPALVAFEDSIIARDSFTGRAVSSLTAETTGLRLRLREAMTGPNAAAARQCHSFAGELRKIAPKPRVLVVGGGTRGAGMEAIYDASDIKVVATDIYASEHVAVIADGHRLPFADGAFQGVWIQAVLEHVLDPVRVVAEIERVLVPDGVVYAETPFMQQVHMAAYDFTRFTHSGHRWLFRRFDQIDAGAIGGAGQGLVWSIRYFLRALTRSDKLATALTLPFIWLRLLDRLADPKLAADAASGFFFLGRRGSSVLAPRDMIDYYSGPRS